MLYGDPAGLPPTLILWQQQAAVVIRKSDVYDISRPMVETSTLLQIR